ncbi:MAG: glycine cleavage system aminomethyltransferase GcvT [Planctomycetota bacterium]|nr:glycine cleavage system aminomethyltransferase GcvT [Planctomycetota bacterium]
MKKTVLNEAHQRHGARLVEFGGFEMPVWYSSLTAEHHAVRQRAGVFDLCHMGRFEIVGDDPMAALDRVVTQDVSRMKKGQVRYSLVCNDEGGVLDDILIYRLPDRLWLVVNAGNRQKLLKWFGERLVGAEVIDHSDDLAMVALQGPLACSLLAPHIERSAGRALADLGYYRISRAQVNLTGTPIDGWISRTGYTGEDGFELYIPSATAEPVFEALLQLSDEVIPCGLGCRDTLRLEAGMPLYGHELSEQQDPIGAGLSFAVALDKEGGFIGQPALRKVVASGPRRQLRGFVVEGKRPARQGSVILHNSVPVGEVTSGSPSLTLGVPIACGYVDASLSEEAPLEVDLRGKSSPLSPHPLPFYRRNTETAQG